MKPRKVIAISVVAISGGAAILILTMPMLGGWLLQRSMRETYDAISKVTLPCGARTSQVIEGWSKDGYSVSCRKQSGTDHE
jgi:hypothetical protein